jgi:methyl-accepting chemotaxis protein
MGEKRPPRKELMPIFGAQMKIVALVCIPLILTCILVSVIQTYFFLTSLTAGDRVLQTALAQQIKYLSGFIVAITLLIMLPVYVFMAIPVSYRIVGPMRRLARELQAIGDGRIGGVFAMRQGDDLTFIGHAVTDLKEGLAERLGACRAAQSKLDEAVARMDSNTGDPKLAAAEVRQAAAELRDRLNAFELTSEGN